MRWGTIRLGLKKHWSSIPVARGPERLAVAKLGIPHLMARPWDHAMASLFHFRFSRLHKKVWGIGSDLSKKSEWRQCSTHPKAPNTFRRNGPLGVRVVPLHEITWPSYGPARLATTYEGRWPLRFSKGMNCSGNDRSHSQTPSLMNALTFQILIRQLGHVFTYAIHMWPEAIISPFRLVSTGEMTVSNSNFDWNDCTKVEINNSPRMMR